MPSKREAVEDFLAAIEEKFYEVLQGRDEFAGFLGGKVLISFSDKKPLRMVIKEQHRPGPRTGQRFNIDPSKRAARRFKDMEDFGDEQ